MVKTKCKHSTKHLFYEDKICIWLMTDNFSHHEIDNLLTKLNVKHIRFKCVNPNDNLLILLSIVMPIMQNLWYHLEWKTTHLSTVSFSGNGALQFLSLTASRKILPMVQSLKQVILILVWNSMDDSGFYAKHSSLFFVKFHLLSQV